MIVDKLIEKLPIRSNFTKLIAGSILTALMIAETTKTRDSHDPLLKSLTRFFAEKSKEKISTYLFTPALSFGLIVYL